MSDAAESSHPRVGRRAVLTGGVAAAGAVALTPLARKWKRRSVFVARNQRYDGPLQRTIEDGLIATGVDLDKLRGKRVLLKPNMVEPRRESPQMTTHPAVIIAVADVFRRHGAVVTVGEAPGHVRDTEVALVESGVGDALEQAGLPFTDLNYDDVGWRPNRGRRCKLKGFQFPRTVLDADVVVSLPKMKTHHWIGVTASMKNLYGVIPGCVYGWPKNVLHYQGIPETVYDINASLPSLITVVDGILCMEGDGPIMGTPKPMGLLVMGGNLPAVDATVCRLMKVLPEKVPYLQLASRGLGPIAERFIDQRGESWEPLAESFEILDVPHLAPLRRAELIS